MRVETWADTEEAIRSALNTQKDTVVVECPQTPRKEAVPTCSTFQTPEKSGRLSPSNNTTSSGETFQIGFSRSRDDDDESYYNFNGAIGGEYSPTPSIQSYESSEIIQGISQWAKTSVVMCTSSISTTTTVNSSYPPNKTSSKNRATRNKSTHSNDRKKKFVLEMDDEMVKNIKTNCENLSSSQDDSLPENITNTHNRWLLKVGIMCIFFLCMFLIGVTCRMVTPPTTQPDTKDDDLHRRPFYNVGLHSSDVAAHHDHNINKTVDARNRTSF